MTNEIDEVLKVHSGLRFDHVNNVIEGEAFLSDGDSYEVLIELELYPGLFPVVFETGGRIPKKADRHVYTDSGSCCFTTRAKSQVLLKTKVSSLLMFINEIVIKYLENNSYYELNGCYFGQEYSHNTNGIIEGYMDILDTDNFYIVLKVLKELYQNKNLKIHRDCYCQSGRRLRKCKKGKHLKNLRSIYMIDKSIIAEDLMQIIDFVKESGLL